MSANLYENSCNSPALVRRVGKPDPGQRVWHGHGNTAHKLHTISVLPEHILVSQRDYRTDDDKYTLFGAKIHSHELQLLQIHQTSEQCTKTDYGHKLNPFSSSVDAFLNANTAPTQACLLLVIIHLCPCRSIHSSGAERLSSAPRSRERARSYNAVYPFERDQSTPFLSCSSVRKMSIVVGCKRVQAGTQPLNMNIAPSFLIDARMTPRVDCQESISQLT